MTMFYVFLHYFNLFVFLCVNITLMDCLDLLIDRLIGLILFNQLIDCRYVSVTHCCLHLKLYYNVCNYGSNCVYCFLIHVSIRRMVLLLGYCLRDDDDTRVLCHDCPSKH